jgi:hypothetical protein
MMKLATPQQVLDLLGIISNTGSLGNAAAALDITSRIVEAALETRLEEGTYTDFFDYEYSRMRTRFSPRMFYLSSRFVDTSMSFVVREAESSLPLRTKDDGLVVAVADYIVDHRKGTVTVLRDVPVGAHTLSITFSAGFPARGTDKVIADAPDWLVQAGKSAAQHYINLNPAHVSSKKITAVKDITVGLKDRITALVHPELRERYGMTFPIRTVIHD